MIPTEITTETKIQFHTLVPALGVVDALAGAAMTNSWSPLQWREAGFWVEHFAFGCCWALLWLIRERRQGAGEESLGWI